MTNLSTAHTAEYYARQSEEQALKSITEIQSQSYSGYGTSQNVPVTSQESLIRSSVDAHLQKVQASQISAQVSMNNATSEQNAQTYIKRKVRITVIDPVFQPIESYWLNANTGQYDRGQLKTMTIKGTITEISLQNNYLVLKPDFASRLLLPRRKFFIVYVVNPQTLLPSIIISL